MPKKRKRGRPLSVYIMSGGAGRTGEQVVNSALAQFVEPNVKLVIKPRIRSAAAARRIVAEAKKQGAIVFYTLVAPKIRQAALDELERQGVPSVDLLGGALAILEDHLNEPPLRQAGLSYALRKEQFDRIDAVDFTLAHDDGQRMAELDRADVVLVGPSRVSKSVVCFYLASHGVRAANVPIVLHEAPHEKLTQLDPLKVISLTMNAQRLRSIRDVRAHRVSSHHTLTDYIDIRGIAEELRHALAIAEKHGWRQIDVSYKSVEEVAEEVLHMIRP